MEAEAEMRSRGLLVLGVFLGMLVVSWLAWRGSSSRSQPGEALAPTITKQPVVFANRAFDPVAPPPDMPPLAPGEIAICDSNFVSNASVRGVPHQVDATHATVTITNVNVTLQLNITIWAPVGANPHLLEH